MIVKMSLKDLFNTATSISHAFCEQIGKPISRKAVSCRLNKAKLMSQTFDFKEKSKGSFWLCHRAYRVDKGTMEYGSL